MTVRIEGLDNVLANIRKIAPVETAAMNAKLQSAGEIVQETVETQAALVDHTLEDLAELGHPYSTRYPKNYGPHGDDTQVHMQSGHLMRSKKRTENLGTVKSSVAVGVSESDVPYIEDLITGTAVMRPRNFIGRGFSESKDEVIDILSGRK